MAAIAGAFATKFAGIAIAPGDDRYDEARAIWNGTVDARPALIARCRTGGRHRRCGQPHPRCRSSGCAVRAGGHSVPGLSMCDGGVVIDLSLMRTVTVDPQRRTAIAEPGATWAGYDAATAAHGLASTGGLISTTGVAGLTLGGGIGWLQRKHGLACDNLVAAEVVTADGSTEVISAK